MSVLLELLAREGSVRLDRYGHQVGGHHLLFTFQDEICKQVKPRERFFYQSAPEILQRYIPAYYGVIDVTYSLSHNSDKVQVVACPKATQPDSIPPCLQEETTSQNSIRDITRCNMGEVTQVKGTTITSKQLVSDNYENPWAVMCSQALDTSLKKLGSDLSSSTQECMILENITSKFRFPCVLDLKIGTRLYGYNADAAKMRRLVKKRGVSTSKNLGVMLCGMQKFNAATREFTCYGKYFGRVVKEEEFSKILLSFFHNGICLRSDLFPILVTMLEDLQASIEALPTFRYYSCSLLIVYDGAVCPEGSEKVIPAVPAVDFNSIAERAVKYSEELIASKRKRAEMGCEEIEANCHHNGLDTKYTVRANGTKDRTLLNSGKEQVTPLQMNYQHFEGSNGSTFVTKEGKKAENNSGNQLNGQHSEENNGKAKERPKTEIPVDLSKEELSIQLSHQCSGQERQKTAPKMTREELAQARNHIDLRMIDFAHATHSGFMDPIKHMGCDYSYLKGLETLLQIFKDAEKTYCKR